MVCSSELVLDELGNLYSNGVLHAESSLARSLKRNPEKLSWSQTKALKMSKSEPSWDYQQKSLEKQSQGLFASLLDDDDDDLLPTVKKNTQQNGKDNDIEEIKVINHFPKKETSSLENISLNNPLRNTMSHPNMMNYQPTHYNNPTSILQKLPQSYNNHNSNNNNVSPKKVVRFQEIDSDIQIVSNNRSEFTPNNRVPAYAAPLPSKTHVDLTGVYEAPLPRVPHVNMNSVYNAPLPSAPLVDTNSAFNAPVTSKPLVTSSGYHTTVPSAPHVSKNNVYIAPVLSAPQVNKNNVFIAPLPSVPHVNKNNVYNAPLSSTPLVNTNTVNNSPLLSAALADTTSHTVKNQLDHVRHKRISEAIEAAIASPFNRLPQTGVNNKTHNTVKSKWSISQKLDHRTHEIMPLKLKLKKDTKTKGRNKRHNHCNKLNCTGCKNANAEGPKKQPNSKSNKKEISFLDLPEDGQGGVSRVVY